ncbi:DgyrCDS11631 [Dimorphilus gyrociliatus]|uniref:DgyrCDS11631 n=1 Tax=Dimorphilus gyrociliatus TaxID=2664684 RepID=A0A7I8W501_9ANNE|nr:DgyrCDS11631 [Dimorphilus gyrociliatus]
MSLTNSIRNRSKRYTTKIKQRVCTLGIIADHKLWQYYKLNFMDDSVTYNRLLNSINLIVEMTRDIYRTTEFETSDGTKIFDGIDFEIRKLEIIDDCSKVTKKYQIELCKEDRTPDNILEIIGSERDICMEYCVVFVFTHRVFAEGLLGYAHVGQLSRDGGPCPNSRSEYCYNVGLVTSLNHYIPVTNYQLSLVLAHEIGHIFSSGHDERYKNSICTPNGQSGQYLMYSFARSEKHIGFCGNNIIEFDRFKNEECDCGLARRNSYLKALAARIVSFEKMALVKVKLNVLIHQIARMRLLGTVKCPKPDPKPDGTLCLYGTKLCSDGRCSKTVCERLKSFKSCVKDEKTYPKGKYPKYFCLLACSRSICNGDKGYCDYLNNCRDFLLDGPLKQIGRKFYNSLKVKNLRELFKKYYWSIILIIAIVISLNFAFIYGFDPSCQYTEIWLDLYKHVRVKRAQTRQDVEELMFKEIRRILRRRSTVLKENLQSGRKGFSAINLRQPVDFDEISLKAEEKTFERQAQSTDPRRERLSVIFKSGPYLTSEKTLHDSQSDNENTDNEIKINLNEEEDNFAD